MYDIIPYDAKNAGNVELRSPNLMGFVAGILELIEDNYSIDYNSVRQMGVLNLLYATKNPSKVEDVRKDNQKIIELTELLIKSDEESQTLSSELIQRDEDIKELKKDLKKVRAENTRLKKNAK